MRTYFFITTLLFFGFSLNAQIDIVTANADEESGFKSNTKQVNITNDLYFLQGDEENMGVYLDRNGVLLIDTQNDEEMSRSLRLIDRLSKKKPIDYLINTSSKVKNFKTYGSLKKDGTIILTHEPKLSKEEEYKLKSSNSSISNITLINETTINLYNDKVKIYPISNTWKSIVYFTKRNVLFTGDAFLSKEYPLIDADNGKSFRDIQKALSKVISVANDNTKIIPGKGDIAKLSDVVSINKMMESVVKQVSSYRGSGKTLEQVLAMKNITKNYDSKGFGNGTITTEMFITSIYNEIAIEQGPIDTRTPEERAMARLKEIQKEKKDKSDKN